MTRRLSGVRLGWAGVVLAAAYWVFESLMHAYVFGDEPLVNALLCEGDANELSMRLTVSVLFVAFGAVSGGYLQVERRAKLRAEELLKLHEYVNRISDSVIRRPVPSPTTSADGERTEAAEGDETQRVWHALGELSERLDAQSRGFEAVLAVTRETSAGMMMNEVLNNAYDTLRGSIPYDRIGVALVEPDGRHARSIWARGPRTEKVLDVGYRAPLESSSLRGILETGEPRILNDLQQYLASNPRSESTRRIVADGMRSSLTGPLIINQRPVGFIFFSSVEVGTYTAQHVEAFNLIAGHLSAVIDRARAYELSSDEKRRADALLLNVMPAHIATRLQAGETAIADYIPHIGVLFADLVKFTEFADRSSPQEVVRFLRDLFVRFDRLCDARGVEKIKTIGDAFMVVSGTPQAGGIEDLANLALDMLATASEIRYPDGQPLLLRIGMHVGPAVAGVIGQRKFAYDVWGDTVNVASRLESSSEPLRIQVSEAVRAELAGRFEFEPRGEIVLRGKGSMPTFFLRARGAA